MLFDVNLNISSLHKGLAGCIYSLVLVELWLTSLSSLVIILLSLVVLVHGWFYSQRYIFSSVEVIRFYQGGWRIKKSGQWYKAWPKGQAVVTSSFMLLPFKIESPKGEARLTVIIFPDSADVYQRHALRLSIVLNGFKPDLC
ncbi:MAG: hypothetical protein PUP46_02610 [Endozoicomonas sp. (ex Botrylloides leachii)]|nr:hypothetical protein [Endozoicomonas sp. (ex Botrylloides leachii)]